jgi:hypothetical protein
MTIARNRTSLVALAQVQIIELDFRDEKVSRLGAGPLSSGMDRQKKERLAGAGRLLSEASGIAVSPVSSSTPP